MDNTENIRTADAPPGSLHPVVRRQFGDCTMILADCLDVLPIEADAVISDPPYGMNLDTDNSRFSGGNTARIARRGNGIGTGPKTKPRGEKPGGAE